MIQLTELTEPSVTWTDRSSRVLYGHLLWLLTSFLDFDLFWRDMLQSGCVGVLLWAGFAKFARVTDPIRNFNFKKILIRSKCNPKFLKCRDPLRNFVNFRDLIRILSRQSRDMLLSTRLQRQTAFWFRIDFFIWSVIRKTCSKLCWKSTGPKRVGNYS